MNMTIGIGLFFVIIGIYLLVKTYIKHKGTTPKPEGNDILHEVFVEQFGGNVSKIDYFDAAIESLLLLHPEIKEQPPLVAYYTRLNQYLENYQSRIGEK